MTATNTPPRGVHLLGSVPLGSAEEVFRTVSEHLGDRVRRIPDGETGARMAHGGWIGWQLDVFGSSPDLEIRETGDKYSVPVLIHIKDGVDPENIRLSKLGYVDAAVESYACFKALKDGGSIPAHVRFQVSLPSPLSPIMAFVTPEHRPALHATYVPAMLAELQEVLDRLPHDELAVQWDVCQELGVVEGVWPAWWDDRDAGILERLEPLMTAVPADVEFGVHLCYGDYGHEHWKQPEDAGVLTWFANRVTELANRPIDFMHVPVPRERDDDAYFAPFADLALSPQTDLYLGLVHRTDGAEGTRRRIATARKVIPDFGIATECGLGRRPPETIPELLALHRQLSSPIA